MTPATLIVTSTIVRSSRSEAKQLGELAKGTDALERELHRLVVADLPALDRPVLGRLVARREEDVRSWDGTQRVAMVEADPVARCQVVGGRFPLRFSVRVVR
jgi:hypothetical protein